MLRPTFTLMLFTLLSLLIGCGEKNTEPTSPSINDSLATGATTSSADSLLYLVSRFARISDWHNQIHAPFTKPTQPTFSPLLFRGIQSPNPTAPWAEAVFHTSSFRLQPSAFALDSTHWLWGDTAKGTVIHLRFYSAISGSSSAPGTPAASGATSDWVDSLVWVWPLDTAMPDSAKLKVRHLRGSRAGYLWQEAWLDGDGDSVLNTAEGNKAPQTHHFLSLTVGDSVQLRHEHASWKASAPFDSLIQPTLISRADTLRVAKTIKAWRQLADGDEDGFIQGPNLFSVQLFMHSASLTKEGWLKRTTHLGTGLDQDAETVEDNEIFGFTQVLVSEKGDTLETWTAEDADTSSGDHTYYDPGAEPNRVLEIHLSQPNENGFLMVDSLWKNLGANQIESQLVFAQHFTDSSNGSVRITGLRSSNFNPGDSVLVKTQRSFTANQSDEMDSTLATTTLLLGNLADTTDDYLIQQMMTTYYHDGITVENSLAPATSVQRGLSFTSGKVENKTVWPKSHGSNLRSVGRSEVWDASQTKSLPSGLGPRPILVNERKVLTQGDTLILIDSLQKEKLIMHIRGSLLTRIGQFNLTTGDFTDSLRFGMAGATKPYSEKAAGQYKMQAEKGECILQAFLGDSLRFADSLTWTSPSNKRMLTAHTFVGLVTTPLEFEIKGDSLMAQYEKSGTRWILRFSKQRAENLKPFTGLATLTITQNQISTGDLLKNVFLQAPFEGDATGYLKQYRKEVESKNYVLRLGPDHLTYVDGALKNP